MADAVIYRPSVMSASSTPQSQSPTPSIALGIDLGTSNTTACIAQEGAVAPRAISVRQVQGPGVTTASTLLPSVLYLPTTAESATAPFALPWSHATDEPVVGQFARDQEARTPDRVIRSAKSWLCNPAIDRRAPVLPWHGADDIEKLSPFEASRAILAHVRRASHQWATDEGLSDPGAIGANAGSIVVTVPASFDEVARQLTYDAAVAAGLPSCTLLEEPQAAFYAWLSHHESDWRKVVKPGDTLMVCDVGGGTADFSLIAVLEEQGELVLSRIAVGDHILLGGDNIDLALAYRARSRLPSGSAELDPWQMGVLTALAQTAKERLLSDPELASFTITIPTRGANLFAAPLEVSVTRADIEEIVLGGFFPIVERTAVPAQRKSASLTDFGLPYAADPALTRHLAAFLARSATLVEQTPSLASLRERAAGGFMRPSAVLFNGGVFNSDTLRERVLSLLRDWVAPFPLEELHGIDRSQAVSVGAAWYARLKASGTGVRVRSATTKSFYIGVDSSLPAVPGFIPPLKGLCIAPRGVEEGNDITLPAKTFSLASGEEVQFRLFASADRPDDRAGDEVSDAERLLDELAPVSATINPPAIRSAGTDKIEGFAPFGSGPTRIPVQLHTRLTELGLLEITLRQTTTNETTANPTTTADSWHLAFATRSERP